MPIGAESLAISETFQLRLKISLIDRLRTYKLCITTLGYWKSHFLTVWNYSSIIRLI